MKEVESRAALAMGCGGETWDSVSQDGDRWTAHMPNGRRVHYVPATHDLILGEVDVDELFDETKIARGSGYDRVGALARIRTCLRTTSDAETERRCIAIVDFYLNALSAAERK